MSRMKTIQIVLMHLSQKVVWDSCELQRLCGPGTRGRISDMRKNGIQIESWKVWRPDRKQFQHFVQLVTPHCQINFKECSLRK